MSANQGRGARDTANSCSLGKWSENPTKSSVYSIKILEWSATEFSEPFLSLFQYQTLKTIKSI